ncbi:hypothetical protein BBJ28_00011550 [Nothophytophthora sp. Chile5]|nr:hypothetical protein BBJ28_00011550 [Nothophytophthora sp. Chile5]
MSSSLDDVAAAPPSPLPLHAAVWAGDVARIKALLDAVCPVSVDQASTQQAAALKELLEAKDVRGNSALHLAVRVVQPSQAAIVKLLLDYDAGVASRNLEGWSCAHDAALCDDEFLLAQMYVRGEKQVMRSLEAAQEPFMQALERLPDFEAEIFIEAHSWVPMVSSVLPSDTIRIYKRGSQLRIDSALKGLDGVKWKRGAMSHVYMGRDSGDRAGHAVVIDHESHAFYDVLEAMHNSSVGNMDLALQVSLTTAMSSSSIDATHLEFVKLKDVKAGSKGNTDGIQGEEEEKQKKKSRSRQRRCPWPGTTYKMQNFSMEAQFRPIVDPERKLKQLPTDKDTPLEELQQFVDHLALHSSKPKAKDAKVKSRHSSSDSTPSDSTKLQTLRLEKGRKIEMHLDVIAGDTIRWDFQSKSSDFCFVATYYHEDQVLPVCRTDGVKNTAIAGSYEAEHNGSFVLMWMNTQKGFLIDRTGIKITYDVAHIRPTTATPSLNDGSIDSTAVDPVSLAAATAIEDRETEKSDPDGGKPRVMRLTDEEKCQVFRRLDHIPNPLTTTTACNDYFKLEKATTKSAAEAEGGQHSGSKKKSSLFKRLEGKKAQSSPSYSERDPSAGTKNTFRSLTLLPSPRRVRKDFEAKVLMTESFPFQLRDFLPVIKFLSTTGEHVKNLEEFFQMTLPPGFPVKFELPMMFTIRVAYTFQKISLHPQLDSSLFEIPSDYHEVFTLQEVRS